MCAQRNIWEDVYGIATGVTNISTAANAATGIPLLNHPSFESGTQTINQRKAIGTSYRSAAVGMEYQQGSAIPGTSFEFDVSPKYISYFLWSLFQTTSFQGAATVYPKYFIPYDASDVEMWMTLVKKLAASGTSSSHRILGAVVKSITLSAEEGQNLKATVEFQGYSQETNRDIASDTLTFIASAPLQWQSATVTLSGTTVNIPGFSLTLSNNLLTKFYDNSVAVRHDLFNFTGEGTIRIPFAATTVGANAQVDAFAAGTNSRLVIYWGNSEIADADDEFTIIANIRRTGATVTGEDEVITEVPFECASNLHSSSVKTAVASTVAIGGNSTITGTNTEFSSFAAGDILYILNATAAGDRTPRIVTVVGGATSLTVFPALSGTETGLLYKIDATPVSITVGDSQNFSTM
jgi:hypothetical protein